MHHTATRRTTPGVDSGAPFDAALAEARQQPWPDGPTSLRVARAAARAERPTEARSWALRAAEVSDDPQVWQRAAQVLGPTYDVPEARRSVRLAVVGCSTTNYLASLLPLAALSRGVGLTLFEGGYGQYRQEILDPGSQLWRFEPDVVLLAVDESCVQLPRRADDPQAAVESEVGLWLQLWDAVRAHGARVVQHGFVVGSDDVFGHLAPALPGSRTRTVRALNDRLAEAAPGRAAMVDVDRIASIQGKDRWFDPRYWALAKLPASLEVLPAFARHTAAVVAADLGLARKCLVLDLDNTVWGGVIGEDGLGGIKVGDGVVGEAHAALQEMALGLKERGVVLAACSKNDEHVAKEPFERHPDMRLRVEDFAVFVANWSSKVDNLRTIADTLDLGLDSLVFVDDNPVERAEVRRFLPEVLVPELPERSTEWPRVLARTLAFETTSFTEEDTRRSEQYRARGEIKSHAASGGLAGAVLGRPADVCDRPAAHRDRHVAGRPADRQDQPVQPHDPAPLRGGRRRLRPAAPQGGVVAAPRGPLQRSRARRRRAHPRRG